MDNNLQKYLENLGLSDIEAKLYLTLLEKGPKNVQELAYELGVNRTTSYVYLNHLFEKGLISRVTKGNKSLMVPTDIESNLKKLLEKRIETTKEIQADFNTMIKTITAPRQPSAEDIDDFEIKHYKGKNGIRKIYEEALAGKEFRSYVNLSLVTRYSPDNTDLFLKAINKNPDLIVMEILDSTESTANQASIFVEGLKDKERYQYRFLPKGMHITAADTLIYEGKVSIINLGEKPTGVVLKDINYYQNSKDLFDLIWNTLPAPQK